MSPPFNLPVCESENQSQCNNSIISDIGQLDGNMSVSEISQAQPNRVKCDKIATAIDLPIVASYNCRSLFPKIDSFKTDMIERQIDCAFASEVSEQSEKKQNSCHSCL